MPREDDTTQQFGRVRRVQRSAIPGAVQALVKQAETAGSEARCLLRDARKLRDSAVTHRVSPGAYSHVGDEDFDDDE